MHFVDTNIVTHKIITKMYMYLLESGFFAHIFLLGSNFIVTEGLHNIAMCYICRKIISARTVI